MLWVGDKKLAVNLGKIESAVELWFSRQVEA